MRQVSAEWLLEDIEKEGRAKEDLTQARERVLDVMTSLQLTHEEGHIFLKAIGRSLDELRISRLGN